MFLGVGEMWMEPINDDVHDAEAVRQRAKIVARKRKVENRRLKRAFNAQAKAAVRPPEPMGYDFQDPMRALVVTYGQSAGKWTITQIIDHVSRFYGVPRPWMVSASRSREIVEPRQVAFWICRRMTTASLPTIGRALGGRDHTTVLHAITKLNSEISEKTPLGKKALECLAMIEGAQIERGIIIARYVANSATL